MNIFLKTEIASALTSALNSGTVILALSDAVSISIITSVSAVIMAGMSAFFAYKAKTTAEATHQAVNSRLDLFMKTAEAAFRAEGIEKERVEERERQGLAASGALSQVKVTIGESAAVTAAPSRAPTTGQIHKIEVVDSIKAVISPSKE